MAEPDYDDPNMPPPDAMGDDRPSDNDDQLNDVSPEFDDPEPAAAASDDDDESLLSEVDEAQFADFDPESVQVAPDFETLNKLGRVSKRQRPEGEEAPKKRKEGRREKIKRNKRGREDSEDGFSGGEEIEGKRQRKSKPGGDGERKKPVRVEINEDDLPPEERRRRALDRAMDAAVKRSTTRRVKKGEIDLESMADQEIEDMRNRMTKAAEEDGELVRQGLPASQKLKMLPQVVALLNRNQYTQAILDPEMNLLEAVRFFLEPLTDGSLPAYNIQRELFASLAKLPMTKEALISSGIGKVIVFYRKSKRTEPVIKRQATKLMEEWSRPLLQRSDDYTKKQFKKVYYDPSTKAETTGAAKVTRKAADTVGPGKKDTNRARPLHGALSYTIAPQVSNMASRPR
ncbi:uncharacterized protein HMPREF1541_10311 [Cyphellophora europaea CBS 101466]|uniref:TFIIS N-terminal domain-containing protein n=1 Tax=Cyphellophora europaea (strain CBS 101466) TaxID=1220924 RepID=W2S7F8_CYPE1|nr:uncharacterized protein HMPREF1541_10311 [Cyphellophora europaea CBS 101466]ETN44641.1 hypothetical protein HMPREF1541_10311 [Cyphellophora europaea CBS 101466]